MTARYLRQSLVICRRHRTNRRPSNTRKHKSPLATSSTINRDWIAAEFAKSIVIERTLAANARSRAESPPEPAFAVLYCEIAAADERHLAIVETIATRYGHTPIRAVSGGVTETLGRLKEKVAEMGSSALDCLSHDMDAKAEAIHRHNAWVRTFEVIGDSESTRELAIVLNEERTHLKALQEGFNRLIEQHACGNFPMQK